MRFLIATVMSAAVALGCSGPTQYQIPGTPLQSSRVEAPDAAAVVREIAAQIETARAAEVYTAETDPNRLLGRPNGYLSKADFRDTRITREGYAAVDAGGTVEVFPDEAGAIARRDLIQGMSKSAPGFLGEYNYVFGTVLLRVSRELTPSQAAEYEAALK